MQFYKKWGLAIAVLILAVGITFALRAQQKANQTPKSYSVTLSLDQWQLIFNGLESIKTSVKLSNMSARESTFISDSIIATLQNEFGRQIQAQLSADQKQKDSTSVKNKKN